MQLDFHYYATYCAARIAGYEHTDAMTIGTSSQMVDCCSKALLDKLKAPRSAATTQLQLELMDARTDLVGLQDITRIWASFHFLPYDLHAELKSHASRLYRNKYRLICKPNGALLADIVELAGKRGAEAIGIAMHTLADTWAHSYFAGTPSLVINNTDYYFYELLRDETGETERPIHFRHSPGVADDLEQGLYTNSIYRWDENSIMNLGHGRAGHLPDYSFIRYKYLPAWGNYEEIIKDNPSDYYKAFCQMVYALRFLRGDYPRFELDTYDTEAVAPYAEEIHRILEKRQLDACADWKALGERIAGRALDDFTLKKLEQEYLDADKQEKDSTLLGAFCIAAMAQKSLVTNKIFRSGSLLAGFSTEFSQKGFRGIRDYRKLLEHRKEDKDA